MNAKYDVYLSEVVNEFVDKTDFVYEIVSIDGGYNGGGSGYIGLSRLISKNEITKHMTCYNCTEISDADTKTETTTCHDTTPTSDCSKEGNGSTRITFIN